MMIFRFDGRWKIFLKDTKCWRLRMLFFHHKEHKEEHKGHNKLRVPCALPCVLCGEKTLSQKTSYI
jgi:hypothetical protein